MKAGQKAGAWSKILTKEFIENQHFVLRKSTTQIGRELGCHDGTVGIYGRRFGIVFLNNELKRGKPSNSPTVFKRGLIPWNKGKVGVRCGKPRGYTMPRGPLHFNWKGGKRDRDTIDYKNWRRTVYERDDYTCQNCRQKGGKLNAHHIKRWRDFPELRYEVSNGLTLCRECHKKEHPLKPKSL